MKTGNFSSRFSVYIFLLKTYWNIRFLKSSPDGMPARHLKIIYCVFGEQSYQFSKSDFWQTVYRIKLIYFIYIIENFIDSLKFFDMCILIFENRSAPCSFSFLAVSQKIARHWYWHWATSKTFRFFFHLVTPPKKYHASCICGSNLRSSSPMKICSKLPKNHSNP